MSINSALLLHSSSNYLRTDDGRGENGHSQLSFLQLQRNKVVQLSRTPLQVNGAGRRTEFLLIRRSTIGLMIATVNDS